LSSIYKKVDFDVDFDDGKIRRIMAKQNIAKKDSIINSIVLAAKIRKQIDLLFFKTIF